MSRSSPILGVALDGAGAHPAASHLLGSARDLPHGQRIVRLARTAERGRLDFIALDDTFDPPAQGAGESPWRLDALLSLAHVAAATTTIGLLATVTVTHTEPFHVSKNIASLDLVSRGRAAWRVSVSTSSDAARRFGRRDPAPFDELIAEADDVVEVAGRLWDSWEDDAVIRDQPTGRYIDREKVHYVDFEGRFFAVRGPSITPRPPQGQPVIAIDADRPVTMAFAARRAQLALVAVGDPDSARIHRDEIRAAAVEAGRAPDDVKVIAVASVGETSVRRELDGLVGAHSSNPALDIVGSAGDVATAVGEWLTSGAVDGFLLQPDALPVTLDWLVDDVLPVLRARGLLGDGSEALTLRERFGLTRPTNRYASLGAPS